ncbi:hypothetical protein H7X46_18370 [Pseudonocardia sp. C8]|uniref:hypothetical protein n=1 Tax=Pseudonocardia sp. C8 TaxID=2762759 RepID=UPI001642BAC1|nr:hypothetical protein [Pseudonocardia sp. C8]MBC3193028.1 hypothetical protein [Pseudonocardia sp. C8]
MRPDTPISETDPADALEQQREVGTEPEEDSRPQSGAEADPADVADQHRDAAQDDEDYRTD